MTSFQFSKLLQLYTFFMPVLLLGQQDTLYYDATWKPVSKSNAAYYRPPVVKIGSLYKVEDYYSSGQLQMQAFSLYKDKDFWQGKVVWYNVDGTVFQKGDYVNNRLDGEFKTKLNDTLLTATYKNGRMIGGQQNNSFNNSGQYTAIVGDTVKTVNYGRDISGIRSETYGTKEKYEVYTKYYGEDGIYIGKNEKLPNNGGTNGVKVSYGRNPMYVREIRYYRDGKTLGYSVFYRDGSPRELFNTDPPYAKTFFDQNGKELGKLSYLSQQYYLKPNEGKGIIFYPNKEADRAAAINIIRSYENGKLTDEKQYYQDQSLKSQSFYKDGIKELIVAYDNTTGSETFRMGYKNGVRYEGTELEYDRKLTYKEGVLIKEVSYYHDSDSDKIFSVKTPEAENYFDQEGNELGKLVLDTVLSYPKPIQGKRFFLSYQNGISSIEEYAKGVLAKTTTFRERKVGEDVTDTFKTETYYGPKGYDTKKKVHYYSNGQIQSEVSYKDYKEQKGTYYDDSGNVIGTYDYPKNEGTLYEFFAESNKIKLFKVVENGDIQKMRRYDYGAQSGSYDSINAVLVEDIDTDCCGTFYSRDGAELAAVSFKNGKPWEGTLYDYKTFSKYTMKNGKREGSYLKYGYNRNILEKGNFANDLKEGSFSYYDRQDNLKKTETYAAGQLNGKATYYDAKGSTEHTMIYKEGLPIKGTLVLTNNSSKKPSKETYENGRLVKLIAYDENGKRITEYVDGKATTSTAFYGDTNIKRLSFSVKNDYLNGDVLRFDEQGQLTHKATLEGGRLLSGELLLSNANKKIVGGVTYIYLKRSPDFLMVKLFGTDNKLLFQAEEDLVFGTNTVFMQELGIYMDYLRAYSLY